MLPGTPLLLTIGGLAGGFPAYGYPSDALAPAGPPDFPPTIDLGAFSLALIGTQLTGAGKIFAFASPGTEIGTWEVTPTVVEPVPEPGHVDLLAVGLATASVRQWRQRHRAVLYHRLMRACRGALLS